MNQEMILKHLPKRNLFLSFITYMIITRLCTQLGFLKIANHPLRLCTQLGLRNYLVDGFESMLNSTSLFLRP